MSAEYITVINGQEYGPVSIEQLDELWTQGKITPDTSVRAQEDSEWKTWQEICATLATPPPQPPPFPTATAGESAAAVKPHAEQVIFLNLPRVRDNLRKQTAYPALRGCLWVIIVVGIIGAVVSVVFLFDDDARSSMGITGLMAWLGLSAFLSSIFSSFVTMVILDIADASLRKIE